MHINSSLPNLIGGVSQQPELLRLPSHLKAQENGHSAPATGLSKRPSTAHTASTAFMGQGLHTTLDYGTRGLLHVEVQPTTGDIRLAAANGTNQAIIDGANIAINAHAYLQTPDPARDIKIVKEADTTFLINTAKTVQARTIPAATSIRMALIWVKAGNYGRTYTVVIPGVGSASYTTPDGSVPDHINYTKTDYIANVLANQLVSLGISGVSQTGSVITLTQGGYAGMYVTDGSGGSAMSLVYRSVRSITELPSRSAVHGFAVKVEGGDATAAGDHYLQYDSTDGLYKEVADPWSSHTGPDPVTMPLVLTPTTTVNVYRLVPASWTSRLVGDPQTSANPAFIGKPINDLFFFQDRMGILSGESFDLSEQGRYFNYYRTTVVDLLDSDPISGAVSHPKVSTLRHAVPFNKRLLAFSNKAQFEVASGDILTPKTVTTRQLSEFECSSAVRPTGMGTSLYFPADRGTHSAFYNFFVSGIDSLEDATDISGHVPRYVPPGVTQMATSPVNNLFLALAPSEPSTLYVYQFYQDGPNRLQSAWHKWTFGDDATILSAVTVDTRLILLVRRATPDGDRVTVETMNLSLDPQGYRLDRAFTVAPTAGHVTGFGYLARTTIAMPYTAGVGVYYAVVTQGTEAVKPGTVVVLETSGDSATALAPGDFSGCTLQVGKQYRFSGTLGQFLIREQAGSGSAGVSRGRTQVARMWVNYASAATFSVEIAAPGRETAVYRSTGRLLGTESARVGERILGDGRFGCPVMAQNTMVDITLVNDTPFPSSFLSVDWEGYHVSRGQNV